MRELYSGQILLKLVTRVHECYYYRYLVLFRTHWAYFILIINGRILYVVKSVTLSILRLISPRSTRITVPFELWGWGNKECNYVCPHTLVLYNISFVVGRSSLILWPWLLSANRTTYVIYRVFFDLKFVVTERKWNHLMVL